MKIFDFKKINLNFEIGFLIALFIVIISIFLDISTLSKLSVRHADLDKKLMRIQSLVAQGEILKTKEFKSSNQNELKTAVQQYFGENASIIINEENATIILNKVPEGVFVEALEGIRQYTNIIYSNSKLTLINSRINGNLELNLITKE